MWCRSVALITFSLSSVEPEDKMQDSPLLPVFLFLRGALDTFHLFLEILFDTDTNENKPGLARWLDGQWLGERKNGLWFPRSHINASWLCRLHVITEFRRKGRGAGVGVGWGGMLLSKQA